jgi:hypothetical protein
MLLARLRLFFKMGSSNGHVYLIYPIFDFYGR